MYGSVSTGDGGVVVDIATCFWRKGCMGVASGASVGVAQGNGVGEFAFSLNANVKLMEHS